jgi:hypothetical protein
MAYGRDSHWPTVMAVEAPSLQVAIDAAQSVLSEQQSCERVEIWVAGKCMKVIARPDKQQS